MTNDTHYETLSTIEKRARQLRAEAVRDGFAAMRRALADAFASLSITGRKAA